jgi:peptidyl-prolyl cis-trans isomerase B (cyclophilin B)
MIRRNYRLFQAEKVVTRFPLFLLLAVLEVSCSGNRQSLPQEKKPEIETTSTFVSFSEKTKEELKNFHVVLKTSLGDIELEFFPDIAPEHVRTFLRLSQLGFYDHTAWHRVVRNFVIQGGDLGTRRPPLQIQEYESTVHPLQPELSRRKHLAGTLSMAHGDEPGSASTSFFICLAPQSRLDNQYTIFGKVYSGMETVNKIASVPIGKNSQPRERLELIQAQILESGPR